MITQTRAKEVFDYYPRTGRLVRKFKNGKRKTVRFTHGGMYAKVRVDGRDYLAHRVIWLMVYGTFPAALIDHKKGKSNKITNLREASDAQNKCNVGKRSHNKSGLKGVSWDGANSKWLAHATFNRKSYHLGRYTTKEAAAAAYRDFARSHHGEFYRED